MIDPVSAALIAAALSGVTGGVSDVSKSILSDTYTTFKSLIQKRFKHHPALVEAIEQIETKPTSRGRQQTLVEEIIEAEVDQDPEIVQLAEKIVDLLKSYAQQGQTVQQTITGDYNATSVSGDAAVTIHPSKDA